MLEQSSAEGVYRTIGWFTLSRGHSLNQYTFDAATSNFAANPHMVFLSCNRRSGQCRFSHRAFHG